MKNLLLVIAFIYHLTATSQNDNLRISQFNLENKLAIQGYDPVAYFKINKALPGKKEISTKYKGVLYYFSSKVNLDLFIKNPSNYEPQYGGWCAYAMGNSGEKVEINPETFKIIDGKLYLFYNAYFTNTLKSWNKNEKSLKNRADSNWNAILLKK